MRPSDSTELVSKLSWGRHYIQTQMRNLSYPLQPFFYCVFSLTLGGPEINIIVILHIVKHRL